MQKAENTGWKSVSSTNLESVRWFHDGYQSFLEIRFLSGSTYLYRGVPKDVYEELLRSLSKGTYHAINIKWSYPFERL